MPIELSWDDTDETIILWSFQNPWTMEEFLGAEKQNMTMLKNKRQRLDLMIHLPENTTLPSGLFSRLRTVLHAQQADANRQVRLVTFVAEGVLNQAFLTTFLKAYHEKTWRLCDDFEDARSTIRADRLESRR